MKNLLFLGVFGVICLVAVGSYVSNYNYGNRAENQIKAEYKNLENILAQYSLQVKEAVQIPGIAADDLARVSREALSGRYGDKGGDATFQWIQENYPGQFDASLYKKIQDIIEAGRNKFGNAQTLFLDTKRGYETNLGYLWKGFWLRMAGYPKIDLDKYEIISSGHAREAFSKGVEEPIEMRPK